MTAIRAKVVDQKTVVFVVYPDIVLLDLVGPLQVFSHARRNARSGPAYAPHVVSFEGGPVVTNTILDIPTDRLANWAQHPDRAVYTLVMVGGDGAVPAARNQPFVSQVRQLADRAERVCSVCSGAFVLAAAGLLDGRRAVTHWEDCDALAAAFPATRVEVDPIYIRDGNVWTSAGITAGIDMSLAIVEDDLGTDAAMELARSLVTPMVRSGGQSQFSPALDRQDRDIKGRFRQLHDWIGSHLDQRLSVADMAERCGMSPRNFSRQYTATIGAPPAKAVEAIRVDAARQRLEASDVSLKTVATECGFQDIERMRRAFLRQINASPAQYRAQFRTA